MAMAKSFHLHLLHFRRSISMPASPTTPFRLLRFHSKPVNLTSPKSLSTTATPFPLQYEMIISRPADTSRPQPPRRLRPPSSLPSPQYEDSEMGFEAGVDKKLSTSSSKDTDNNIEPVMDKAKMKYYNKRRERMYGESEDEDGGRRSNSDSDFIELKQEVVELQSVHMREEELYFHNMFSYPWEKNKHYKMVYQLEKKHFPDQCFDEVFLDPGSPRKGGRNEESGSKGAGGEDDTDRGLVFFEESEKEIKEVRVEDVMEKKVEDFFRCLKKFPNENGGGDVVSVEPFMSTKSVGLPPKWDSPYGTVVLVNKPKGWTSFTVCGKLRRLVQVKKVGHAGTLDPMATGLLIVCVGKATKIVDRNSTCLLQIPRDDKGHSGIFRLGEATSTWDADSPVIQREPWEHIKDEDIKKAAVSFSGEIWQVPPMFSAIKVGGERMYKKARKGESIELSPRRISIFNFDVERSLDDRQNVIFRVTCSKGTYVRSLCADLGKALGSCAHLTALRRDSMGQYSADDAWEFQELEDEITKGYI